MFDARFRKDPKYVPEPVPEWLRQAQGNYDVKAAVYSGIFGTSGSSPASDPIPDPNP